jgi:N4-gp56 family major capsid protein
MAIGTSSTLTQEFVDMLNAELLLAPDPQYIFAQLADAARAGALGIPETMGRAGAGGFSRSMAQGMGHIDRMSATAPRFAKVISESTDPGKVILIDRPAYLGGTFTETSRRLTEGTAVTATPQAPTMGQVSLTIREYAGPHDGSNVAPIGITDFLKRRAKHDLIEYVGMLLRRDRNKFVDRVIVDELLSTSNSTVATGSDLLVSAPGSNRLTAATLADVKKKLLERGVPTFPSGNYMLVLSPQHEVDLRADDEYREVTRYLVRDGSGLTGYSHSFGGFDICVSANITTTTPGGGNTTTVYQALAFGPESIGWAIGMDAEARRSKDDDFGREDRVLWIAHEAFKILNSDFVEKIQTT